MEPLQLIANFPSIFILLIILFVSKTVLFTRDSCTVLSFEKRNRKQWWHYTKKFRRQQKIGYLPLSFFALTLSPICTINGALRDVSSPLSPRKMRSFLKRDPLCLPLAATATVAHTATIGSWVEEEAEWDAKPWHIALQRVSQSPSFVCPFCRRFVSQFSWLNLSSSAVPLSSSLSSRDYLHNEEEEEEMGAEESRRKWECLGGGEWGGHCSQPVTFPPPCGWFPGWSPQLDLIAPIRPAIVDLTRLT